MQIKYLTLVLQGRLKERNTALASYLRNRHKPYEIYEQTAASFYQTFTKEFAALIRSDDGLTRLQQALKAPYFSEADLVGHNLQCSDKDGMPLLWGDMVQSQPDSDPHITYKVGLAGGKPALCSAGHWIPLLSDTCLKLKAVKL
jgi:hypothetical protein